MGHFKEHFKNFKPIHIIGFVIGGIVLALVMAFLLGYFVMILWNWLMPVIFGLVKITYWQAWGLVLLSHILFKFGAHHPNHGKHRHHFDEEKFKKKFEEKTCDE